MLAVLELNDRRKFACGNLEEAKQAWRDNFSTDLRARIVVYPRLGEASQVLSYAYDAEKSDWVPSHS